MAIIKKLTPAHQTPVQKSDLQLRLEMADRKRAERVIAAYNAKFKKIK